MRVTFLTCMSVYEKVSWNAREEERLERVSDISKKSKKKKKNRSPSGEREGRGEVRRDQ